MNYFLLFSLFINSIILSQQMNLNIIPTPQKIISPEISSHFAIGESISIESEDLKNPKVERSIELLKNNLKSSANGTKTIINLELIQSFEAEYSIPENFEDEAYILNIEEKLITIKAKTPKGIYYGTQTLIQLVDNHFSSLPACKIIDYPVMKIRGISDDISRGQVSNLENFKRIIRFLARYKMNTYMPYIEDMIEFEAYPSIGIDRGALKKSEIKEIIEYADEHFIEVIPIFQTLGHFENILSQPEFIKYADFPGAASLDVTNEETYKFLETMLNEVFELFPSKYFHMGADESYDVGLGKSRNLVEQSDLATVHANHYKRVYDICKKNNKEVMMYGDIILNYPDILNKIPKDIIIVDWHYHPSFEYPSAKIFQEAGFNYIVSPSVWNFNASFPENFLAVPNIEYLTNAGLQHNSIGMINSCWGDYGAETFKELNYYGYAWSAQCSWNFKNSSIDDFENNFFFDFYGNNDNSIAEVYKNLNDPINQVVWNSFWRHPLLQFRNPDWREYKFAPASKHYWMNRIDNKEILKTAKSKIVKNNEHFELVEFSNDIKNYFYKKIKTQKILHKILNGEEIPNDLLFSLIDKNITELKKLKERFKNLWLKYNKGSNLWMIEDKFDRFITYFEDIKAELQNGKLESPLINSKWIYTPNKKNKSIWKSEFKQTLSIDEKCELAQLQLIGDTFAKLFINGKEVDSVFTKRSGSLWIEQQRVKLLDITDLLEPGDNQILVEVRNYYDSQTPGINIIAEVKTASDKFIFTSNENWKVKEDGSDKWIPVEVKENSLEIIAPNFKAKRKSWIER